MPDTKPNIIVEPKTPTDLYAVSGIAVGTRISVRMIANGNAKLYAGATLVGEPTDATGFRPIRPDKEQFNDTGDAGAFIWSLQGCTVNVKEVV